MTKSDRGLPPPLVFARGSPARLEGIRAWARHQGRAHGDLLNDIQRVWLGCSACYRHHTTALRR